jgi:ribosomal protein S8E
MAEEQEQEEPPKKEQEETNVLTKAGVVKVEVETEGVRQEMPPGEEVVVMVTVRSAALEAGARMRR